MKEDNSKSDRRGFLRTAGAALVAASVPAALAAQTSDGRGGSGNNMKQMVIFGGISEPLPSLPGVFGQASFQFQMQASIDSAGGGIATLSDPVFSQVNSQIEMHSGRYDLNDFYVFQGTVKHSLNPDLMGKQIIVQIKVLPDDNANVWLTIENTPIASLLLPAIQKVRDKNGL